MTTAERFVAMFNDRPVVYVLNEGDDVSGPYWVARCLLADGASFGVSLLPCAHRTADDCMREMWRTHGGNVPIFVQRHPRAAAA
jgi:hypothetical protein